MQRVFRAKRTNLHEKYDYPGAHQLARPLPLRVMADHEGFLDAHRPRRGEQGARLLGAQSDRLLAQHMLACGGGLQRQRHVKVVGQWVVDGLDLRVGQQLLVRAIGARDPQGLGRRPRGSE